MHAFGKALIYSFATHYSTILVQILRTTVLARLIAPEEFGTFALAYIAILTAMIFKEFGVHSYIIKENTLNQNKIRSAYGLLISIASLTTLVVFFSAGYIAEFYQKPDLSSIIQLMAISIFLSPFGSLISSLLSKAMDFRANMIANLYSQIASTMLMICLAWMDFGVYALAWGSICQTVLEIIILQLYRPANMPLLPKFNGFSEIFAYAKFASINSLVSHAGNYVGEILSGKHFSLHTVGILNRASNTAALFNGFFLKAFTSALTPYISQINNEGQHMIKTVKKVIDIQLLIAWPFFAYLSLSSDYIVFFMFGEQWLAVAPLLTYFATSRILYSFTQLIEPIFIGMGKASICMKLGLVLNSLRIIVTVIAIPYGIETMVLAVVLSMAPTRFLILLYYINRELGIKPLTYLSWSRLPLVQLVIFSIPLILFNYYFDDFYPEAIIILLFVSFFSVLIYLLIVYYSPNGKQVINLVSECLKK